MVYLLIYVFVVGFFFKKKTKQPPVVVPALGGCCAFPAHFSRRRGSLRLLEPGGGWREGVGGGGGERGRGCFQSHYGPPLGGVAAADEESSLWLPSDQSSSSGQQDGRSTGVQDTRLGSAPVWSDSRVRWVWSSLLFWFVLFCSWQFVKEKEKKNLPSLV